MKLLSLGWAFFFGVVSFSQAFAQDAPKADDNFRIKGMREVRGMELIQVGDAWVKDPKRILVTLRVKKDTPASAITLKAYFYGKDNTEVFSGKPNPIWAQTARGYESVGVPAMLQKDKDIDVYFCVTQEIELKKWKSVAVVFGDSSAVVARSLPASALPKLTFPEQDRVVKEKAGLQ